MPKIVQQNKSVCASLYCSLQDYNCLFFNFLSLSSSKFDITEFVSLLMQC